MLMLEWGAFEILTLMASFISIDATGAQVIALNVFVVFATVPFGGQTGIISCVGKAMGQGNSKNARIFIKIAVVIMLVINVIFALILVNFKQQIASLFTSNQSILT